MKTLLLKTTGIWVAGAMLTAGALAQSGVQGNSTTPRQAGASTRHLSATGRMATPPMRVSKIIGDAVADSSGNPVGQIADILVNPASGKIDFAVISLNSGGKTNGSELNRMKQMMDRMMSGNQKLVPVPWSLLQPVSTAETKSAPSFTLTSGAGKLSEAPSIDPRNWSETRQPDWRQRVYAYFGVEESATGAAESPSGAGKGSQQLLPQSQGTNSTAPNPQSP